MNTYKFISSILLIFFASKLNLIQAFKSAECNYLQPYMFNKLALGVDLSKLNLFPDKESFYSRNGFKDSIFNLTCFQKNNFTLNNFVLKNLTILYHLPDHMSVKFYEPDFTDQHNMISQRKFESDEENYKQNMMNLLNINKISLDDEEKSLLKELNYNTTDINKLLIGAFKLSKHYGELKKERYSNRRIPIESRINITGYIINLDDNKMALTHAFQNEINELPDNYEDSRSKYESLISTFGTHYFKYYIVGGLAKASFKIVEDEIIPQLDQLSQDQFKNDQPFNFDIEGLEFDIEENFGTNEKLFLSDNRVHKRTINFYGGRIEKIGHNINRWKNTTLNDPWIVAGGLAPLSRLIKNKQKKRNFLRAMMSYLDKAEILNLKESVSILEENDHNITWLKSYKEKIDELNQRQFINHTNLIDLSKQFNNEIDYELHKRLNWNYPENNGLFTSVLDNENEKKNTKKIKFNKISNSSNSNVICFWLTILLIMFNFIRYKY